MNASEFGKLRKSVTTSYGEIAYVEKGEGPVALFVHGVLLNGYLWRDAVEASDMRRCIASTSSATARRRRRRAEMSFDAEAGMLLAFIDAGDRLWTSWRTTAVAGSRRSSRRTTRPHPLIVLTNCDTRQLPSEGDRAAGRYRQGGRLPAGAPDGRDAGCRSHVRAYEDTAFSATNWCATTWGR
jgi:hypothetical protein